MFVKKSWNTKAKKKYIQYHIAESYRDKETGMTRHRLLLNITKLPDHVIQAIDESLKKGKKVVGKEVEVTTGDAVRGAGLLALYRAWKHEGMEKVLKDLTEAERQSVLAMVAQRVLEPEPKGKLALKKQLKDTLLAKIFSATRLDEDELYEVMDKLEEDFYHVQENLQKQNDKAPTLYLYDVTSTYFEGTQAEDGEYGHSRDKRKIRYQIVIGLVCDEEGIPLALEVWKGNTPDKTTVGDQVKILKERFNIQQAVFVGDKGMYSTASIDEIVESGFGYILGLEWHKQRNKLQELAPQQLELFDRVGVCEWEGEGIRYVGCASESRKKRAIKRRKAGVKKAEEELDHLVRTASSGKYYSWTRLREKVNGILKKAGVKDLFKVEIEPLNRIRSPEEKAKFRLTYTHDQEAIKRRKAIEGKYVLQTSLSSDEYSPKRVEHFYKSLQQVERAFRDIKSFLNIRPINHYRKRRVRAHVLICFLGYYLVKKMELTLREVGITKETYSLLRDWDKLELVEQTLKVGEHKRVEWQWTLGEVGKEIKEQIKKVGWWRSIDAYKRSLINQIKETT